MRGSKVLVVGSRSSWEATGTREVAGSHRRSRHATLVRCVIPPALPVCGGMRLLRLFPAAIPVGCFSPPALPVCQSMPPPRRSLAGVLEGVEYSIPRISS